MKKLFYLGFCLVLMTGFGCAITNYALITDNNQTSEPGGAGEIRDTTGKAKLIHASQWATSQADGIDELLNFVDQDASGGQTLYTHNNFSVAGEATFSDDLYCSPENKGCAAVKSFDPDATDPSDDPFDGKVNDECPGARSLSLSLSTGRYYGECGRTGKLSLADQLNLWNIGRLGNHDGMDVLMYNVNRSNASITLDNNAGFVTNLNIAGNLSAWTTIGNRRAAALDATNPLIANTIRGYADFLGNYAGNVTTVTITYGNISREFTFAGNQEGNPDGISTVSNVLNFAARY